MAGWRSRVEAEDYDRRSMDRQFGGLWAVIIYLAVVLTGALVLSACGGSEESTDEADQDASVAQPAEGTEAGDGEASEGTEESEGPTADAQDDPDDEEEETNPVDGESVENLLASVESAAQPLGDVIGATRPAGLEPVNIRVDSYPRLCPADNLPIEAVLQEDPLLENLPVQRYILAFSDPNAAATFFDELASTEIGCVDERTTEVANATATINEVVTLDVIDDVEAIQIGASIAVDMINFDRDPPGSDVVRSVAIEGSTVIIVVSIADYGLVIGVADVHGPLLTDGVELVRATG